MSDQFSPNKRLHLNRRHLIGGATALVGAAGLGAAGVSVFAQDATPGAGTPAASPAASPEASGGTSVVIQTVDIAFQPNVFTIPADTDATVTIENHGNLQHDFAIDELNLVTDLLNGGDSTTVTINAPAGTYEYYCTVTGHREAGMVGTLTVE